MRSEASRHVARVLCTAIDRAQEMVVAASFLLADEDIEQALLRAAKRRVRVYLLLATETRLEKEPRDDSEFEQRALEDHKKMLTTLAGWALIRSAPGYHAKVVLVDPARGGPGYLLTANLTREALSRNEELAVELTSAESQAVFEHLAWAMWEAAEHELLEPGRLSAVAGPLKQLAKPTRNSSIVATLQEPGTLRAAVLQLVGSAKREIVVASFGWDADHEVVRLLCTRAKNGLPVTVLARIRPVAMPALLALVQSGARVLGYDWLHAKAIVVDAGTGLVMSGNLQRHGLDDGFELGVTLDGSRATASRDLLYRWIVGAPYELRASPKLGEVSGNGRMWTDKKLVPFDVAATAAVTLGSVVAASADKLESEPPALRGKFGLPHPAHQVELSWNVEAPRLGPKAKEIDAKLGKAALPSDPQAFREINGRIVVAVRTTDEIGRAREIAKHINAAAIVVREDAK
jgi:cardiolipin synthase